MNQKDYHSLSDLEKIEFIDNKMKEILKSLGYKLNIHKLKPKDPSEFIFFKKPNIIILKEDKISDDHNYVQALHYALGILQKEFEIFKNDKLIFIHLMEFPIHHLITFLIQLSYHFPIEIYFPQEQINKFSLKELENLEDDEHQKGNLKIFNLDDAVKNKYLEKKF